MVIKNVILILLILTAGYFLLFYAASRPDRWESTKLILGLVFVVFCLVAFLNGSENLEGLIVILVMSKLIFFGGASKFVFTLWHEELLKISHRWYLLISVVIFSLVILLELLTRSMAISKSPTIELFVYLIAGVFAAFWGFLLERHRKDTISSQAKSGQ